MSEVTHRLATKEAVDALTSALGSQITAIEGQTSAIQALPNATQQAADNANAAAAAATTAAAAISGMLAPTFSTDTDYAIGEYVYKDGNLYRFKKMHEAGAWDSSDVDKTSMGEDTFDRALTSVANVDSFGGDGDAYSSLADLPGNTLFRTQNAPDRPSWQGANSGFWVITVRSPKTSYRAQIGLSAQSGRVAMRYYTAGAYTAWVDTGADQISVLKNISSFGGEEDEFETLADLPQDTVYRTTSAPDRPEWQSASSGFWVWTLKNYGATNWVQIGFSVRTGDIAIRYRTGNTGSYSAWVSATTKTKRSLNVLCIGNSFTLDNMSYMPFILQNVAPDIDLTLYFAFKPSAGIDDHIDAFNNDTSVYYKCKKQPNTTAWSVTANTTLKSILDAEQWDFITFQQNSANQTTWSSFANLNTLIDKIVGYLNGQGNHPVRLGWLMPQLRTSQESHYSDAMTNVQKVLETTPIDFVIPCGTAVENARGTSLQSLGDDGNLQYTDGHLQEGLPCMIGAYTATIKILELFGRGCCGILGEGTLPTAAWLEDKNIPNPQGDSVGATTANCYIAQKCAVAAIKNPFEVTGIDEGD